MTIVQLGATVGEIVAWRTRAFRPKATNTEQEGEIGLQLQVGAWVSMVTVMKS